MILGRTTSPGTGVPAGGFSGARPVAAARDRLALLGPLALLLLGAAAGAARGADLHRHPSVDVGAPCASCHANVLEGKGVAHALRDCKVCHALYRAGSELSVGLASGEPGLCLKCHADVAPASKGRGAPFHPPPPGAPAPPAAGAASASSASSASSVPAVRCTACHTGHDRRNRGLLKAGQAELCVSCHDAAALAPKHGGIVGAATHCTSCHAPHAGKGPHRLKGSVVHAPVASGSCSSCHRGAGTGGAAGTAGAAGPGGTSGAIPRLKSRGNRLCLPCHEDKAGTGEEGSTHSPLKTERRDRPVCLACHDQHLSPNRALLRTDPREACTACHAKLVEAGRSEPVCGLQRGECGLCHDPHSSPEKALVNVDVRELCLSCHDRRKPGLSARHLKADMGKLDCLSCHSTHGDCQPKSLARVVHPPVLDGCDACHEGGDSKRIASGGGADLCEACHGPVFEAARASTVRHAPMEAGSCRSCHAPHAAGRRSLMRTPPEAACAPCHSALVALPSEEPHGVIALLGCEACHEPHGGKRKRMLRASGAELCLACHGVEAIRSAGTGPMKVFGKFLIPAEEVARLKVISLTAGGTRGHPTAGHLTVGTPTAKELKDSATTFSGPLECGSCHDPHRGAPGRHLVLGASSTADSCQRCHRK